LKGLTRVNVQDPSGLTKREQDVLELVAKGLSNNEIGAVLHISARTAQKHLERVYEKLDVGSRTAAVASWYELIRKKKG